MLNALGSMCRHEKIRGSGFVHINKHRPSISGPDPEMAGKGDIVCFLASVGTDDKNVKSPACCR
jgi:hypothetical protein